jgi:hypothetical protein
LIGEYVYNPKRKLLHDLMHELIDAERIVKKEDIEKILVQLNMSLPVLLDQLDFMIKEADERREPYLAEVMYVYFSYQMQKQLHKVGLRKDEPVYVPATPLPEDAGLFHLKDMASLIRDMIKEAAAIDRFQNSGN